MLLVGIQMKYGQTGFKTTFRGSLKKQSSEYLKRELGLIIAKISLLIGTMIGFIIFSFRRE